MSQSFLTIFLTLVFVPAIICRSNYFLNPPDGSQDVLSETPIWEIGSNQLISWSTNYTDIVLTLWQNAPGANRFYLISECPACYFLLTIPAFHCH